MVEGEAGAVRSTRQDGRPGGGAVGHAAGPDEGSAATQSRGGPGLERERRRGEINREKRKEKRKKNKVGGTV